MLVWLLALFAQDPAPPAQDPADERRAAQAAARAAVRERARVEERAKRVLMNYFQEDRHADLGREELQNRLLAFDRDEDARVSLEELRRLAAWSPSRALRENDAPPPVEEAWHALLRGADANGDGVLGHDEALAFFDAQDLDTDRVLTRNERPDGPRVGDRAPDFALAPPGGENLEALSSLLKQGKPVALLFGSWT